MALALGLAPHTGWAIAVVIDGRRVIDRTRIDLAPTGVDRQVFHAAEGPRDVVKFVAQGEAAVLVAAQRALADFEGVVAAGIVGHPRSLPDVPAILANHTLQHAAEGELYRAALEETCIERGWEVVCAHAKDLRGEADTWKGAAGPPWQLDHRLAAAVAMRSVGA